MGFSRKNTAAQPRSSNIELYRVVTMVLIVLHHYTVNSGLLAADGPVFADVMSPRSLFLLIIGAWGKTGINCFVLITGYFMCRSRITLRKFTKLLLEVMFYKIIISLIFWLTGYAPFSWTELLKALLPVRTVGTGFVPAYLVFFLCIPFLNILIANLSERQHVYLLLLLGFVYVFLGTVPSFSVTMNYVSWFAVLYFLASYIRLYPKKLFDSRRFWGWATVFFVVVSACSVVVCAWLGRIINKNIAYYFVTDSNTLLAVCTALSSFLFVKNTKVSYNRFINRLGASAFGVLLIHASSDTMRQWLWQDMLNCTGMYDSLWMPVHAIGSALLIFAVCFIVDSLRIRFLETPIFTLWDRYESKFINKFQNAERKICNRLHISYANDGEQEKKT